MIVGIGLQAARVFFEKYSTLTKILPSFSLGSVAYRFGSIMTRCDFLDVMRFAVMMIALSMHNYHCRAIYTTTFTLSGNTWFHRLMPGLFAWISLTALSRDLLYILQSWFPCVHFRHDLTSLTRCFVKYGVWYLSTIWSIFLASIPLVICRMTGPYGIDSSVTMSQLIMCGNHRWSVWSGMWRRCEDIITLLCTIYMSLELSVAFQFGHDLCLT